MFTSPYNSGTSLPMWPQNQQQQHQSIQHHQQNQQQQHQSIQHHQQNQQSIHMGGPGNSSSVGGGTYRVAPPPNHQHYSSSSASSAPQARMDLGSFGSVFSSQAQLPAPQQMRFTPNPNSNTHRVGGGHHPNDSSATLYPSSVRVEIDSSGTVGYADASHELGGWAKESPHPNSSLNQPFRRIIHDNSTPDCSHELAELSHLPTPISSSERSASISMFAVQHSVPDQMVLSSQGSQSLPQLPYPAHLPITAMAGSSGYHQGGTYSNSSNSMLLHHQAPPPPGPYSPGGPMPMGASAANMHPSSGGFYIGHPQQYNHYVGGGGGPLGSNGNIPMYSPLQYPQIHHHHHAHNPYQSSMMQMAPHGVIHPPSNHSPNNARNNNTANQSSAAQSAARRVQPSALDHPEHSPLPPCNHNNWDNLRVKKSIMMLACRDCGSKWRRVFPPKDMCEPFHGPAQHCPAGRECPKLHVHRYKNRARPGESGDNSKEIGDTPNQQNSGNASTAPKNTTTSSGVETAGASTATINSTRRPSPPTLTLQDSEGLLGSSGSGVQRIPDVTSPLTPLNAAVSSRDDDEEVFNSSPLLAGESLVRTSAHHLPPNLEEPCQ